MVNRQQLGTGPSGHFLNQPGANAHLDPPPNDATEFITRINFCFPCFDRYKNRFQKQILSPGKLISTIINYICMYNYVK